jgi:predicted dehydrogenase
MAAKKSGKTINLAIVGCGGMAGAHLNGYEELLSKGERRFRIVAAVDELEERARAFASRLEKSAGWKVKAYRSVAQLLDGEEGLDGADICSPHGLHHVLSCQLLEAGVNVLCEKPIGVTVRATKKIMAAARKHGKIAATAEQCRRSLGQRAIHWAFNESGLLGRAKMWWAISASWRDPAQVANWHWRVDRKLGGCGMVMDSGAHWVDTMRYWFGEVESVYARVEQVHQRPHRKGEHLVNSAQEDFWTSIFNFESGLIGTWSWSIGAPGKGFTQLMLSGTKGSIIDVDIFHPAAFQARGECQLADGTSYSMSKLQELFLASLGQKRKEWLFPYGITGGVTLELWDFIDALSTGRNVEIDVGEGLRSKAVSEAIYESGKSGQVVRVADVLKGKVDAYQRDVDRYWKLR